MIHSVVVGTGLLVSNIFRPLREKQGLGDRTSPSMQGTQDLNKVRLKIQTIYVEHIAERCQPSRRVDQNPTQNRILSMRTERLASVILISHIPQWHGE